MSALDHFASYTALGASVMIALFRSVDVRIGRHASGSWMRCSMTWPQAAWAWFLAAVAFGTLVVALWISPSSESAWRASAVVALIPIYLARFDWIYTGRAETESEGRGPASRLDTTGASSRGDHG